MIERIPGAFNDTPFWVISASRDISRDHSDVRNPMYGRKIEQIIGLNEVYRADPETWMLSPDPAHR